MTKTSEQEMNERLVVLLQTTGDGIVDVFQQMLKGHWRDVDDHDVKMNVAMLNLQKVVTNIMEFRTSHMGYSTLEQQEASNGK